MLHHT